jgi:AmmeMemoRadiSam system protein A
MLDPILLRVAKSSIMRQFDKLYGFDEKSLLGNYPFLKQDGAAFVTLKYDHSLRGCIGSIIAHRSLYGDIAHNALAAAFRDPRFNPLGESELSHIDLEVSVLSKPEILEYEDFNDLLQKVRPDIDGLILSYNGYQGTFLPQVWEQLKTPREFLEHLSMKAGLNPSVYENHPVIYRYRVDAIEKKFDEITLL